MYAIAAHIYIIAVQTYNTINIIAVQTYNTIIQMYSITFAIVL